jgi:hypothetical protein
MPGPKPAPANAVPARKAAPRGGLDQVERFHIVEGDDARGARFIVYRGQLADYVSGAADGDDSRWLPGCDLDMALLDQQGKVAVLVLSLSSVDAVQVMCLVVRE